MLWLEQTRGRAVQLGWDKGPSAVARTYIYIYDISTSCPTISVGCGVTGSKSGGAWESPSRSQ